MQRKNREIQIFSLSALDLFCSAMGAMIVLSIVLMPSYRKNTTVEDLEVVFVVDGTGSMGGQLQDLKRNISSTVTALQRMCSSLRVGVVVYRDHGFDGSLGSYTLTPQERLYFPKLGGGSGVIQTNLDAVQSFPISEIPRRDPLDPNPNLERLQAFLDGIWPLVTDGNRDIEESVYLGIETAIQGRMNWERDGAGKKMLVLIGDGPTHDHEWSKLENLTSTWKNLGGNRHISTIYTPAIEYRQNKEIYEEGRRQFKIMANEGQFRENAGELMGSILDSVVVANQ